MAQGTMASVLAEGGAAGSSSLLASLTVDQVHEIRQYENLLRFRDEVVGGLHPRIKPTHLLGKPASSVALSSASASAKPSVNSGRSVAGVSQPNQTDLQRPPVNVPATLPGLGALPSSKPFGFGKPEINPVLLEKSDDLIKAETQLRRQRVERGLREQIEQRRASHKASLQASEQLADFDIADVMARAMALVESTAQPTDDTAANASASSDSFDNNTFYSSQHDTPSSNMISRIPNESDDEERRDGSPYEPELDTEPVVAAVQPQPAVVQPQSMLHSVLFHQHFNAGTPGSYSALSQSANFAVPGLSSEATSSSRPYRHLLPPEVISSQASGTGSRSEESGITGKEHTSTDSRDLARVNERLLNHALDRRDSPLVRAHDLSPIAPQPSHVSPLAVAHQPPMAQSGPSTRPSTRRGTPAQVAALRKQASAATSPDSSPQGNRAGEKKKNKKKKRKADRLATQATAPSPHIKPEPRSPSPLTAPSYDRPNKRQRQSHQQPSELGYREYRSGHPIPVEDNRQERYQPRIQREERVVGYERVDRSGRHEVEPIMVASPRYERVYYDEPRSAASNHQGRLDSPQSYPPQYLHREVRTVRPPPHVIDSAHGEPAPFYHEMRTASRASARPAVYRAPSRSPDAYQHETPTMPPPRAAPTRLVFDAFGREYIEPLRQTTVIREGMAPDYRAAESERIYDRAPPPRAVARMSNIYGEDAVLYRPASPAHSLPRRVVTQPGFVAPDHRIYRDGGHTMEPLADEYGPSRPRLDTRPAEPPREYIARAASARPPMDLARHDGTSGFDRRVGEELPRQYIDVRATSTRPPETVRYDLPVAYDRRVGEEQLRDYASVRSASVRPAEAIRYEVARDYRTRVSSVRPELSAREYATAGHPDTQREMMQPPPQAGRSYSAMPNEANQQAIRREFSVQPAPRYYGRPPVQNDDDVIVLDRPPQEMYRNLR